VLGDPGRAVPGGAAAKVRPARVQIRRIDRVPHVQLVPHI
jgi:hypothetical protein